MNNKKYSPSYFFRSSLLLIFMAEVFVMLILPAFPNLPFYSLVIIDAVLLSLIVIPLLYVLLFKPMVTYSEERDKVKEELRLAHNDLERRVEERTDELKLANDTLGQEIANHKLTRDRLDHLLDVSPAVTHTSKPNEGFPITYISGNIKSLLSYEPREFTESSDFWIEGIHPEDKERVLAERGEVLKQGQYVHEYRFRHKDGSYRWMHDKLELLRDSNGEPYEIVGSWIDITGRVQLEEELRESATIDKLTKAYNRSKFEEIVSFEMERSRRYVHPLAMLLFDIDKFKWVNDNKGHLVGDEAIKAVVDVARKHMRRINHLVRWGGDEFIILPVETEVNGATILAERIRQSVEMHDFGEAGRLTVSFGISMFKDGDTEDAFLKRADDALYKAKEQGGNCIVHGD